MDELLIRFNGFQPSEFTRAYLDEKISAIYDEAPYGASLRADFSRLNREFKGLVTIQSPVGRFFAVARGTRLRDVTHRLTGQIRRQLDRWKSRRFDHRRLQDMEVKHDTDTVA